MGTATILVLSTICILGISGSSGDRGINISNECLLPPQEGSTQEILCPLGGSNCKLTETSVPDGAKLKITCPKGKVKQSLCSRGIWSPAPTCSSCGKKFKHKFGLSNSSYEYELNKVSRPWEAMIYRKNDNAYRVICGGVLISRKAILSSSFCFMDFGTSIVHTRDYKIGLGKFNWHWDVKENHEVTRDIKALYTREDYDANLYSNDVAVIIMSGPVEKTSLTFPACVDWASSLRPQPEEKAIIAGFSNKLAGSTGLFSRIINIELTLKSMETCRKIAPPSFWKYLTRDKFCGTMENVGEIMNIAGLGLTYYSKEKNYVLGLASLRPKETPNPLVLSKIAEHIDFIGKHVDEKYVE